MSPPLHPNPTTSSPRSASQTKGDERTIKKSSPLPPPQSPLPPCPCPYTTPSLSLSVQPNVRSPHSSLGSPATDRSTPQGSLFGTLPPNSATTGYAVEGAAVLISEQMSTEINPKVHAVSALCIICEKIVLNAKTVGNRHVVEARI